MVFGAGRYDGHSEWYDQHYGPGHPPAEELAFFREALGSGCGQVCVDLACGTGRCAQVITEAGYRSAGFDISADQLRFARRRFGAVARADVCLLPVQNESVPVVVGMFFHADSAERTWCKHCADLGFHVEDMCVTSAVSLWCRQVGCERALNAARRARARVTDLAIWRSCGGAS